MENSTYQFLGLKERVLSRFTLLLIDTCEADGFDCGDFSHACQYSLFRHYSGNMFVSIVVATTDDIKHRCRLRYFHVL